LSKLVWARPVPPRVARLRASDAPRPRRPARALSRSASHSIWGRPVSPRSARLRQPTRGFRRAPQDASAGVAPLGASLRFALRLPSKALLYGLPRGRRAVAGLGPARKRRREPRQVRKGSSGTECPPVPQGPQPLPRRTPRVSTPVDDITRARPGGYGRSASRTWSGRIT